MSGRREEKSGGAPWRQWGEHLEPDAVRQLENACRLPVTVRGALMLFAALFNIFVSTLRVLLSLSSRD